MPNTYVITTPDKEVELQAYLDAATAIYQRDYEPGGSLGWIKTDKYGQICCTYYGPPYTVDGINVIPEPPELIPLREATGGVIALPQWPDEEV